MDFQLLASMSLTGDTDAIDIDDAVCDVEAPCVVVFQTGCEFLAFDACDTVAVAANLIAVWTVVCDALKDCCRRQEGMADE